MKSVNKLNENKKTNPIGSNFIEYLAEEKPDMNKLITSDDSIKSAIKMELSSYIENEWQNKNIE